MKYYDPSSFCTQNSLGYLLKVNQALMQECAERVFSHHDISFVQWIALRKLKEGAALTASDLCRTMFHDNGAITRMLDQLEEKGYVERHRSQQDRRVVELQLTPAGLAKVQELTPLVVDSLNTALTPFSMDEFTQLILLLEKLKNSIQSFNQDTSSQESS